jgi:hypothetical protein
VNVSQWLRVPAPISYLSIFHAEEERSRQTRLGILSEMPLSWVCTFWEEEAAFCDDHQLLRMLGNHFGAQGFTTLRRKALIPFGVGALLKMSFENGFSWPRLVDGEALFCGKRSSGMQFGSGPTLG